MFRLINLLIALLFVSSVWAQDNSCNSSECRYRLTFDRAGAYIAIVTLPGEQPEGLWSLVINPSNLVPPYRYGFWAGSILTERAELPSWVGFSLYNRESINVIPYDWTGNGLPVTVQIYKDIGGGNRASVYGPTLMAPGQMYLTPPLEPGFYITELWSQPDSPRTYLGLAIEGDSLYGGVSGGWLDSYSGEGYAAFVINDPTTLDFLLLFCDSAPGLGAGPPHLEIYYQYQDGTRELYWSAPPIVNEAFECKGTTVTVADSGPVVEITGQITDAQQQPLSGIKIKIPVEDGVLETFSAPNGSYSLSVPNQKLPTSFAILAFGENYVPNSQNVTKTEDEFRYVVNFIMKGISPDMVIPEIEPIVHHLGNDSYGGAANSQFQQRTEGLTHLQTFETNDFQLSFPIVEISLMAKGLQQNNPLLVNGNSIGFLDTSPSDGSFAPLTWTFDSSLLSIGSNTLEIRSADTGFDSDDFEFTNIVIRFRN